MLIKKSSDGNPSGAIRGLFALIIVCLFGFFSNIAAQSAVGFSGAPFLKISPAARQVAMGEAFTALSGDINLMRYNVGGLGGIKNPSLAVNFNTWIDDTQQGNIAFGYPFKKLGVIGLDMTYFDEGRISMVDEHFVPIGGNGISGDIMMSLGYGKFFRENQKVTLGIGFAGKYLLQSLVGENSSVFALDAGAQMHIKVGKKESAFQKYFILGAALQNFGLSKMKFDVWESPLPETYKLGAALLMPFGKNEENLTTLTLAADALYTDKEQIKYFLGSELFIGDDFALRGGYKINETSTSNWAAGFGVNIPAAWLAHSKIRLDYAYAPLPAFDEVAHRFSLHFAFGKVPVEQKAPIDPDTLKKLQDDQAAAEKARIDAQKAQADAEKAKIEAEKAAQRARDYENELAQKMAKVDSLLQLLGSKVTGPKRIPPNPNQPQVGYQFAVYFDFDKASILSSDFPTLRTIGEILNTDPYSKVQLSGHTDWVGEEDYNINLSQRRLDSVIVYLSRKEKVAMSRFFMPVGYGESRPVADNTTDEGRQKNRRVEFNIYFEGNEPPIPEGTAIKDVRVLDENTIQIECNGRIGLGKTMALSNPDRFVIDFDNIFLLSNDRDIQLNRGPFIKARLGYHGDGAVKFTRVVLDTRYPIGGELSVDRNYIILKRKPVLEQSLEKKN